MSCLKYERVNQRQVVRRCAAVRKGDAAVRAGKWRVAHFEGLFSAQPGEYPGKRGERKRESRNSPDEGSCPLLHRKIIEGSRVEAEKHTNVGE